jgi:hypothetical protein
MGSGRFPVRMTHAVDHMSAMHLHSFLWQLLRARACARAAASLRLQCAVILSPPTLHARGRALMASQSWHRTHGIASWPQLNRCSCSC